MTKAKEEKVKPMDSFEVHKLKTWPEPFAATKSGDKTHEVRVNDRRYQVGDVLELYEWDPETVLYSGAMERRLVTHITRGFGLPENIVVMSVRPVEWLHKVCVGCGCGFTTYDNAHTHCVDCL